MWSLSETRNTRRCAALAVLVLVMLAAVPVGSAGAATSASLSRGGIRAEHGRVPDALRTVTRLGGVVARRIDLIDGIVATVPSTSLVRLQASPAILSVSPDGAIQLLGKGDDGHDAEHDPESMYSIRG